MTSASPWWWTQRETSAVLGVTRRGSGASTGPFAGFNLARHVGDDETAVEENRRVVLAGLVSAVGSPGASVRPLFMNQVHGAQVRVVTDAAELSGDPPPSDAVVTTLPDVALFTLVADCTPVLLVDGEAGVAGAVHAGRPGMLAGVVTAAVSAMRDLGARRIHSVIGPSVCGRCYEVPPQMRNDAARIEPVSAAVTWTGTTAIDVAAGVAEQLRRSEVSLRWIPGCTREEKDLYSYRRDARTGRFAGVVMLTAQGANR